MSVQAAWHEGWMGLLGRFERRLGHLFEGGFARLFRGGVPPTELLRAVADAVETTRGGSGDPLVANAVTVALQPDDLAALSADLTDLLAEARERIRAVAVGRGLPLAGRPAVDLVADSGLARGTLVCTAAVVPGPGRAALLDGRGRVVVELEGRSVNVGRDPCCELQIEHPDLSRRHARIEPAGIGYVVCDLGSTNGTTVNGRDAGRQLLADGDLVAFGPVRLVFQER